MNITRANKSKPEINHLLKSILLISANYKTETLYHLLVKNPSLVNTKDQKNETFLSYAIKRKNIETAELILTSPKLDLSYQDNNGNTYLHLAVFNKLENIIRLLIKKGININLQNNDGNTALHFAYNTGDIKFMAVLIENNADLNIKNKDGLVPEEIKMNTLDKIQDNNKDIFFNNTYKKIDNINNNSLLTEEKNEINKTIQINWETNNSKINSSKNTLKYSLVNFSYSDDDNSEHDSHNNIIDKNDDKKKDEEKKYNTDKTKEKADNLKNSDIFDLTSSLTYKAKIANISCLNSHIVGTPNILKNETNENDNDLVNVKKNKTNESKYIFDSIINNKKPIIKNNTNNVYKRNIIEYNSFINKENKDNDKDNEKINDYKNIRNTNKKINKDDNNTITYQPDLNCDNFCFSPFVTIKESLYKKKDINKNTIETEKQQMLNNTLKNIHISNTISNNNSISNNIYNLNNNINNNISLTSPTQLNSKSNIDLNSSVMTADNTVNKSKIIKNSQDSLYIFLLEIKLEKYYNIMSSNGFDDVKVLINQMQSGLAVTDIQLKEAGIDTPGDRAKIIIRLQEKACNFIYHIPKSVYHICNEDNYMNDTHVKTLYDWLKPIKVEEYIENFIDGGYHCVELMLLQMESKSPITDAILRDDLGIKKIGHRARIINKLLEEGKKLNNKLKNSMLIVGNGETEKICECNIF